MDENVYDARAMLREATVVTLNDTGGLQTVDVLTDEGATYSAIPVMQAWGHAGSPPLDGLKALLMCVGGDPANMRAILYSTGRRLGGLAKGESVSYANNGARVAFRQGGTIELLAGAAVIITAPDVTVTATVAVTVTAPNINLAGNVTVDGNFTTTGSIHADGGIH